jgi:ferrous iron transport protein B
MMHERSAKVVALIGNPNTGKTTLFNALTGLRQNVGNYAGVTVEKKEGLLTLDDGTRATLIDLPGTYGLTPYSPDQQIAIDVLLGKRKDDRRPDIVLCVADATNLERNLYLVSQILDVRLPVILVLTMTDVAGKDGMRIETGKLRDALGVPVIPVVAAQGRGLSQLRKAIGDGAGASPRSREWKVPGALQNQCIDELSMLLQQHEKFSEPQAFHEALVLLTSSEAEDDHTGRLDPLTVANLASGRAQIEAMGVDRGSFVVEARYEWIQEICSNVIVRTRVGTRTLSDRLDDLFTHKVWGFVIFFGLMALVFQMIFSWAEAPMNLIGEGIHALEAEVTALMPRGELRNLIVDGVLGGVGAVITFLPQIMLLFVALGVLEDSGYMARAAFIMDRAMSKVGLHGKSFIPLLSSFACAIPGIMATRTIENKRDRIATMLVAPLMSCSARLPVYSLMIAAFIPPQKVLGLFSLPGLTLVSMYMLGLVVALSLAWLFKKTLLKSERPTFIMELPPFRMPSPRSVLLRTWEQSWAFLKRAGTFILGVSIVLWFLTTHPKIDSVTPAGQLEYSYAGQAARTIEPLIMPLGFNWKIGIGLIGSLLQREVFVSTMGTIYNISDAKGPGNGSLIGELRSDVNPSTGAPVFTTLTALCLMVYFVLAMQCMSTVAVVHRETNGWRWPAFLVGYMSALAWVGTFVVYRIGLLIT